MQKFTILMTNLCGLFTTGIMAYGVWFVIKNRTLGVDELTFLMFVGFILTALFGSGGKKEN